MSTDTSDPLTIYFARGRTWRFTTYSVCRRLLGVIYFSQPPTGAYYVRSGEEFVWSYSISLMRALQTFRWGQIRRAS